MDKINALNRESKTELKHIKIMSITGLFQFFTIATNAQDQQDISSATINGLPFGISWGFEYGYEGTKAEKFMPRLYDMGIQLTRLYLFWQQIEPTQGHFNRSSADSLLDQLDSPDEALSAVWSSSTRASRISTPTLLPSPAKLTDQYSMAGPVKHAEAEDIFGIPARSHISSRKLLTDLSSTPVYIECKN